jgi:uncharacterized small protein (DUF1192 family)
MTLKGRLARQDQEGSGSRGKAIVILVAALVGTLAYFGLTLLGTQSRDRSRERERTPEENAYRELSSRSAALNLELASAEAELDRYTHRKNFPDLTPEELRECEQKIAYWKGEVERRQAACDGLMHELLRLLEHDPGPAGNTGGN